MSDWISSYVTKPFSSLASEYVTKPFSSLASEYVTKPLTSVASNALTTGTQLLQEIGENLDTPTSESAIAYNSAIAIHLRNTGRLSSVRNGRHGVAWAPPRTPSEARWKAAYWSTIASRVDPGDDGLRYMRDRLVAGMSSWTPALTMGDVWWQMGSVIDRLEPIDPAGAAELRVVFAPAQRSFYMTRAAAGIAAITAVGGGIAYFYFRRRM